MSVQPKATKSAVASTAVAALALGAIGLTLFRTSPPPANAAQAAAADAESFVALSDLSDPKAAVALVAEHVRSSRLFADLPQDRADALAARLGHMLSALSAADSAAYVELMRSWGGRCDPNARYHTAEGDIVDVDPYAVWCPREAPIAIQALTILPDPVITTAHPDQRLRASAPFCFLRSIDLQTSDVRSVTFALRQNDGGRFTMTYRMVWDDGFGNWLPCQRLIIAPVGAQVPGYFF